MSGTVYVQASPDGTWFASVAELPGAAARGATRDEAVAKAKQAFRDYLGMLELRGVSTEHWKALDPDTFGVREPAAAQTYDEDFRPLEEHELRDFLHQLEAVRSATLGLVRGLSSDELERRPTESTWSVREALEHVMFTEVGLVSKLEKWPLADGELPAFQAVHRLAFQRFTVMDPDDTKADHTILGRRFSVRKVMRRILEHEFEHQGHIREILAALGGDRAPE
ncbi:MAG TPA: type II toxin-antitoxin system HicB family antitoxin [Candidatus Limnocylindria bacterium]|nr:type II toxin-antitoxin system HicB family antitoxin [Candidatus Limnocylindria bacterium]